MESEADLAGQEGDAVTAAFGELFVKVPTEVSSISCEHYNFLFIHWDGWDTLRTG